MKRSKLWTSVALVAGVIVAIAVAAADRAWRWAVSAPMASAPESIFVVPAGTSLGPIAGDLESRGFLRSAFAFKWLVRSRDLAAQLQAGEYLLSPALTAEEILERIAEGRIATYAVSIPEGLTAAQVGQRLEEAGLADAAAFAAFVGAPESAASLGVMGDTLEGYLFPETYRLPKGMAVPDVAKVLVDQFLAVWREIEPRAEEQKIPMRDVVILASIVEKETAAPEERPLIASVFRNRIERGMRLETDPTVIYGIKDFDGNLRRRDLEDRANPYNTYVIPGLPPGPIANPGADALRAVVAPMDTDYLFFVSKNDGTHTFSKTYDEHELAVNKYQRRSIR